MYSDLPGIRMEGSCKPVITKSACWAPYPPYTDIGFNFCFFLQKSRLSGSIVKFGILDFYLYSMFLII